MVHRSLNLHVDVFAQLQQPAYIPQRLSPYPLSCHKNSFFLFPFFSFLLSRFIGSGECPTWSVAQQESGSYKVFFTTRFLGERFLIAIRGVWLVCAWGKDSPLLNQYGYPCCAMQSSGVARI